MPSQAGFSPTSIYKEHKLNQLLYHLVPSTLLAHKNRRERYNQYTMPTILDMTCGPGVFRERINGSPYKLRGNDKFALNGDLFELDGKLFSSDGTFLTVAGSPVLIAYQIAHWQAKYNIKPEFACVDKNTYDLSQIKRRLDKFFPEIYTNFWPNQREVIDMLPTNAIGFSYWDFNGYKDLDDGLLGYHGSKHSIVDILITRACVDGKRMNGAKLPTLFIDDYLRATGKRRLYVVNYAKWRWWSFGFASNWVSKDRDEKLRRIGFVDIESEEGERLIAKFRGEAE